MKVLMDKIEELLLLWVGCQVINEYKNKTISDDDDEYYKEI